MSWTGPLSPTCGDSQMFFHIEASSTKDPGEAMWVLLPLSGDTSLVAPRRVEVGSFPEECVVHTRAQRGLWGGCRGCPAWRGGRATRSLLCPSLTHS